MFVKILKCISQLELAQLFGINATKGRINHHHHPSNASINSLSSTFSLPFDNLFNTEKGMFKFLIHTDFLCYN